MSESPLKRYTRNTVGANASPWSLIWHEIVLGLLTGLPGVPGFALRNALYPLLFAGFNRSCFLGRHVTLRCPRQIHLGEHVVVDEFVQLIATSSHPRAISIGHNTFIRSAAMLNAGSPDGYVHIGDNSSVGQGTVLYGNGGLTIGNNVLIAGQCFIVASSHNFDRTDIPISEQGFSSAGIVIGNDVWIGAGVKILDGVEIGSGCVVGANSVVNRSVEPYSVVAGTPAKLIRKRA